MLIGYARLSPCCPQLSPQLDALQSAGCERVFSDDGLGGGPFKRPALDAALATLTPGDVLVVWKLDRLGRSMSHLIQLIKQLGDQGIGLRSLSEAIDTTTSSGQQLMPLVDALVDFERCLVTERTQIGLAAAKHSGAKVGRKPKLTAEQVVQARQLIDAGESPRHVAKRLHVSTATLYRKIPAAASNRNALDLFTLP